MSTSLPWFLALLLVPVAAPAQQTDPAPDDPVVVTSGQGVVRAAPDRAWVSITAESRGANPRDAQRRNAEVMQPVLDKLRAGGIPADAIRTSAYDLHQEWDVVNDRRVSRGFVARNTVDVRVDPLDRLGEILELAVGSGATSIGGVRFDLQDRAALEREALQLAVADARARADAAAKAAGRAVSRIVRLEERGATFEPPMPFAAGVLMRESGQAAAPPISAGQIELRAQVTLTVTLE